jgi:Ca2+-binding RTX toxin-like protein
VSADVIIDGAEAANDFLSILGLDGNDTIDASGLNPSQIRLFVDGGAGNDTIRASNGGDIILGGDGDDTIIGGTGDDHISGNAGDDVITGGGGNDIIDAGDGNDVITTGEGVDFIQGGAGDDRIESGGGHDTIEAGDGNDIVTGGAGEDVASLGNGDDRFIWNPGDGSDTVNGGTGFDTLTFNGANVSETIAITANGPETLLTRDVGAITMHLADVEHIEVSTGGGTDDVTVNDLTGTGVKQVAIDLAAFGTATGDGQADTVTVNGTADDDAITLTASGSALTVGGLSEQVTIDHGEAGDHLTINAGAGNDTIDASAIPAGTMGLTLNGGDGNDTFKLGAGNVLVNSGAGDDTFVFNFGHTENVVIEDFQVHTGGLHQADTIVLQGFSDHSFDQLVANGHIFQSGADVVISDGTHTFAALQNVSLAALHANDFLFS